MSSDNVVPLRHRPPDILAEAHPGLELGLTAAQPTITGPSTGAPKMHWIKAPSDTTISDLETPGWWRSAAPDGIRPAPGDIVIIDLKTRGARTHLATMCCHEVGADGPIMRPWTHPRPLRADAILIDSPLIPLDGPRLLPAGAHVVDTSTRKLRMVARAVELLAETEPGWKDDPRGPPFLTEDRRNEAIRGVCRNNGAEIGDLPSDTLIARFYRRLRELNPDIF